MNGQAAVVEKTVQGGLLIFGVPDRGGDGRFVENARLLQLAPREQGVEHRLRLFSTDFLTCFLRRARDRAFDLEERADVRERDVGPVRIGGE